MSRSAPVPHAEAAVQLELREVPPVLLPLLALLPMKNSTTCSPSVSPTNSPSMTLIA